MEQEMEREKGETERKREEMTAEKARTAHARAAYVALVRILRGTVVCESGRGWGRGAPFPSALYTKLMLTHFFFSFLFSPDRLERFAVYRRDVGDTLVNAYVFFSSPSLRTPPSQCRITASIYLTV
jgi:hypothetical protein